ncbi:hypothetical protein ACJA88_008648 [Fusarium oxysporum]
MAMSLTRTALRAPQSRLITAAATITARSIAAHRSFSTTNHALLPSGFGSPVLPSYFSKPRLPANTVVRYGVEDAEYAISQLAQTTMRSEIGQLTLDHVLKERAALNTNITAAINDAAEAWGVTCLRYEIRDIHAPGAVVEAMHRQVTAERSKRAEILESEGQRQSAINIAEGKKQSVILASEALRAERINEADGEAEAIRLKATATAQGIDAVSESILKGDAGAQAAVSLRVAEKYVDAFGKLARESTAVVVPGNVGDISGMIATGLSVFGKVGQAQAQTMAKSLVEPKKEGSETETDTPSELDSQEKPGVKETVIESFNQAAKR